MSSRAWVTGKLHGITVTAASVAYSGSVTISRALLDEVDMLPYQAVDVINLNPGARGTTYLLAVDEPGVFTLNGGGARLGVVGDRCVVIGYETSSFFDGAKVAFCDETNAVIARRVYQ